MNKYLPYIWLHIKCVPSATSKHYISLGAKSRYNTLQFRINFATIANAKC